MEIESIMANNALIKAREGGGGKGRSWKWKELLRFPHVRQCMDLAMNIERDYFSLCVRQPIGKKLFQLFCRSRLDLHVYASLQDALSVPLYQMPQAALPQRVEVLQKYEQSCRRSLELDPCGDVFHDCREDLHRYLSGHPFLQYQDSMFFERFLQWKMLERSVCVCSSVCYLKNLSVWACQVRATGQMYACKKLEKTHIKKRRGESMALNEKQLLEGLDSRFVVNLAYAYETKHSLCIVLTMMDGGDLKYHIHKLGPPGLDSDRVRFYAAEVFCGLNHLHQQAIVYRDLKPENVLLDLNGHIRISDLGLAVRLSEGNLAQGRVGTVGYMAPEVIGRKYYGMSPDWWGLGCLIYEMTAGQLPFRAQGEHPKVSEMERRIQTEKEKYDAMFSIEVKDICSLLLTKDPEQRLGCQAAKEKDVQSHPFFQSINFRMLEAGLVEPPFKPDPRLVYCNDVQDIEEFSTVKGVSLDQTDSDFYSKFNTGSVPLTWQNEMIETGCFKELNLFGPQGSRTPDLDWSQAPGSPKRSLLDRILRRNPPPLSEDHVKQSLLSSEGSMGSGLISTAL
uniref:G protein-coupled receptor kinase n=1 Tax=Myripristis murdjan TaxID=586833 RepID=A0A667X397_9TELE